MEFNLLEKFDVTKINGQIGGMNIQRPYDIRVVDRMVYCVNKNNTIIAKFYKEYTKKLHPLFITSITSEENITVDYLDPFGMLAFYKALLKQKVSIILYPPYYKKNKNLWYAIFSQEDTVVRIFKKHKINNELKYECVDEHYDWINDLLDVWNDRQYLILCTTIKNINYLSTLVINVDHLY